MPEGNILEGTRLIVTGASRGLGRAIAIACARSGATVGINFNRSEKEACEVADRIGARGLLLRFDVADPAAVAARIPVVADRTGGIDALVNNAASSVRRCSSRRPTRTRPDPDESDGPRLLHRAAIPDMLRRRRGVILNVQLRRGTASVERAGRLRRDEGGDRGADPRGRRRIRPQGHPVRVHQSGSARHRHVRSHPGAGGDEVLAGTPWKRFVEPDEIAGMAVVLLSERAGAVSGTIHTFDGGVATG
jgi:3-oxoacyl-[acyl-carrier protein] reductase